MQVLDAAEALFHEPGVQSVGMDEIRSAAGVSLKRLYQLYSARDRLIEAVLCHRDRRWCAGLAEYADARPAGDERIPAVFDWRHHWFSDLTSASSPPGMLSLRSPACSRRAAATAEPRSLILLGR
ncbi:helix-turn-helix domain-containing protein, partial [Pseudonocardia sp.]|uniref:TetR/AcrR family transcriptional regulator n=1 Tax=Pseudonocardia sp. TaxID=60912 RepID=UPI0031FDB4C0